MKLNGHKVHFDPASPPGLSPRRGFDACPFCGYAPLRPTPDGTSLVCNAPRCFAIMPAERQEAA